MQLVLNFALCVPVHGFAESLSVAVVADSNFQWNTQLNSGEELVKAFRKVDPKLPIIVTAPPSKNSADLQKSCPNASNYLTLPFTTEQLRKTVSEYVPSIAG
jgi:DNA-binding NtrC family response regulator